MTKGKWLFSGSSPGMQDVDNSHYIKDYLEFKPDPLARWLSFPPTQIPATKLI